MNIQSICDNYIIYSEALNNTKEIESMKLDAMLELLEVMQEKVNEQKKKKENALKEWENFNWKEFIGKQIKESLDSLNIDFIEQHNNNPFQMSIIGKNRVTNNFVIARFEAIFRDDKMTLMYFTGNTKDEFKKGTLGESLGMNMEMKPLTELTENNINEVFRVMTENEVKIYGLEVLSIDK